MLAMCGGVAVKRDAKKAVSVECGGFFLERGELLLTEADHVFHLMRISDE
jgi:hypothetical protein